jgi:hypothetical protein
MKIDLEVIEHPGGALTVLLPAWRVKASVEAMRKQAETTTDATERARMIENAESIDQYQSEIRDRYSDRIQVRSYEIKPYTYGGKLEAKRRSTTWENGQSRFDEDVFRAEIVALGLGKSYDEVLSMAPTLIPCLYSEIVERSEPEPSKLDFLPS